MSNGAAVFNERLLYPTYEIINGTKYRILASTPYHCYIMLNIFYSIFNYCKENKDGYVFFHGAEVKFSEENIFQPDIVVVKTENKNIIDWKKSINGAPDLVVEVFSRSTMKKDLIVKKTLTKNSASKNIGLLILILKLFRFIFCATENINLTLNIFAMMKEIWKK